MPESRPIPRSILPLAFLCCLTGSITGLIVTSFRLLLVRADHWRDAFIQHAHAWPLLGMPAVILVIAGLAAAAAFLVRRFSPYAGGSGIPHVEAVANGILPPAPLSLIPVKFIGGVLAIGGGLALGREGPSVQMGADIGVFFGKKVHLSETDCVAILAACGGAGIATAFNAPIAGAIFVLEELLRRFDTRTAVAALGSSCFAVGLARLVLGNLPDFIVVPLPYFGLTTGTLFLGMGIVAGIFGAAYNLAVVHGITLADRLKWPLELRAALVGALVGVTAWLAPDLVGGGDPITQHTLNGEVALGVLPFAFALRFLLGPLSYAAGTPGGLFAPMLVLGAQLGLLFASACHLVYPHFQATPTAFAVVAMAAFFTAVVRAPVTGIVLVTELTGSFSQLMPMLWACFGAMIVPSLLRVRPIYDSLSQPYLQKKRSGEDAP